MLIISIACGSGSGKSAIAKKLGEHFGNSLCVICHDRYYKSQESLPSDLRALVNYDHPEAFDTELLCRHLDALSNGESVKLPIYDYSTHTRSAETDLTCPL